MGVATLYIDSVNDLPFGFTRCLTTEKQMLQVS